MRTLDELMAVPNPAWPHLEAQLRANPQITVLPVDEDAGRACLHSLQVTPRSQLGALALHTGGLLIDDGWIRVLGGGGDAGLPSLAEANGLPGGERPPAALLVGHDVLGGRFEVSGPDPAAIGRPGNPGEMCYFGPDTLEWEGLGTGHSGWLSWLAGDGTSGFYASVRWPGWRDETRPLPLTHGITIFPFLWSKEAHEDMAGTTRRPAPMTEIFAAQDVFVARFAGDPGAMSLDIRTVK